MKSFAFAFKNQGGNENPFDPQKEKIAECHLNIWKVHSKKFRRGGIKFYFDIGLKLSSNIESIYVYIPFEIENENNNFDLVNKLQNNNQLLCTVFNCDYKSKVGQGDNFCYVYEKGNPVFALFHLGATKFELTYIHDSSKRKKIVGTLIKIDLRKENLEKNFKKSYIRFRVSPKRPKEVAISENISNDFLQAAFSQIDLFDFRINEIRNINTDVMDIIRSEKYLPFSFDKVHLFYMSDTREKVNNGSSLKQDSRLLETDFWNSYLPDECKKRNFIAYHWKKREKRESWRQKKGKRLEKVEHYIDFPDYRIFFSAIYPKIQLIRLCVYLCVAIFIGWTGSMLTISSNPILENDLRDTNSIKIIILILMATFVISYYIYKSIGAKIKIYKK